MKPRRRLWVLVLVGLLMSARPARAKNEAFSEDVFACEDALAHLQECCPSFAPSRVRCAYERQTQAEGCDRAYWSSGFEDPAFSVEESACILNATCEALVAERVCERAQVAHGASGYTNHEFNRSIGGSSTAKSPQVCP